MHYIITSSSACNFFSWITGVSGSIGGENWKGIGCLTKKELFLLCLSKGGFRLQQVNKWAVNVELDIARNEHRCTEILGVLDLDWKPDLIWAVIVLAILVLIITCLIMTGRRGEKVISLSQDLPWGALSQWLKIHTHSFDYITLLTLCTVKNPSLRKSSVTTKEISIVSRKYIFHGSAFNFPGITMTASRTFLHNR